MKTISVSLVLAGMMTAVWAVPEENKEAPDQPVEQKGTEKQAGKSLDKPDGKGRSAEGFWSRADTNGDGFVSLEEFSVLKRIARLSEEKRNQIFKRLDKDDDSKLSKKELGRLSNKGSRRGIPRLAELDTDKSGGVNFEEFKASAAVKNLPPEGQERLFKRLDRDGDGQITPKDRPPRKGDGGSREEGGPPGGGLRHILRTLDANDDRQVTFEEFKQAPFAERLSEDALEDRFEKFDRNDDKKLTIEDAPPRSSDNHVPSPPKAPENREPE